MIRIAGNDRYSTSTAAADALKQSLDVDKLENIIVASGADYPDVLAGSYLAKVKDPPVMLLGKDANTEADVKQYINKNLKKGRTVYLLGGTGVVSEKIGTQLKKYDQDNKCERVAGQNRYLTSVAVAKEFFPKGSDSAVLAYAMNFPDGLAGGPLALSIKAQLILIDNSGYSDAVVYAKSAGIEQVDITKMQLALFVTFHELIVTNRQTVSSVVVY